jgi:hypothetical protein
MFAAMFSDIIMRLPEVFLVITLKESKHAIGDGSPHGTDDQENLFDRIAFASVRCTVNYLIAKPYHEDDRENRYYKLRPKNYLKYHFIMK